MIHEVRGRWGINVEEYPSSADEIPTCLCPKCVCAQIVCVYVSRSNFIVKINPDGCFGN